MGIDFNKYNPIQKPPLQDWTESVPVVLLSEALKIVGKKHGISLTGHPDGLPRLCFRPGLKDADVGSDRWNIAEQATGLFVSAIDDLKELISAGKLQLPEYQAGPSRHIESIRVAKPQ